MSAKRRRSASRVAAALVVGLCALALCGASLVGSWRVLSTQDKAVDAERGAVAYTKPLVALTAALAAGQGAVVSARAADPNPIRGAAQQLDAAEGTYGVRLDTAARWSELRSRTDALVAGSGSHDPAAFAEAVALAVDLLRHILTASGLNLDPDRDTHALIDASLDELPSVMLNAALAIPATGATTATDRQQAAAAAAVARYQVALGSAGVSNAVSMLAAGTGATVNAALTAELDSFSMAINTVTPPALVTLLGSPTQAPTPDAVNRLEMATLALDQAMLVELDVQLSARADQIGIARRTILAEGIGVLASVLALLWLLSPRRNADLSGAGIEGFDEEVEAPQIAFIAPHDLLGTEELVHVGRAVRARPAEHDDVG